MNRLVAAVVLLLRFAWAVVVSGWQTVLVILREGTGGGRGAGLPADASFMRVPYAPMSPTGAAILGCMVSLTPGTTTVDIDPQRHELLLHVLDASDPQGVLAEIQRDFEPWLVRLFPESPERNEAPARR